MKVIGLTGGTGSGKSVISGLLQQRGSYTIDCDKIAHDIILKGGPAYGDIVEYFGTGILDGAGEIDRKKLGEVVFGDPEKLAYLNRCTHHRVQEVVLREMDAARRQPDKYRRIVLDVPLFSEAVEAMCDEVWAVFAREEVRIHRIMERDGISRELAERRLASQEKFESYAGYAHSIIDNSLDLAYVEEQLDALCHEKR